MIKDTSDTLREQVKFLHSMVLQFKNWSADVKSSRERTEMATNESNRNNRVFVARKAIESFKQLKDTMTQALTGGQHVNGAHAAIHSTWKTETVPFFSRFLRFVFLVYNCFHHANTSLHSSRNCQTKKCPKSPLREETMKLEANHLTRNSVMKLKENLMVSGLCQDHSLSYRYLLLSRPQSSVPLTAQIQRRFSCRHNNKLSNHFATRPMTI